MVSKSAVTLLALVGTLTAGPCSDGPTGIHEGVVQGTWGGENAALIADDTSAHVHVGCTYGGISQPIVPDASGKFDVPGLHNITAHPVDLGVMHPARFSGQVLRGVMTFTITLTDTAVTLGPVSVAFGKEPRMGPCPICRPGMVRGAKLLPR